MSEPSDLGKEIGDFLANAPEPEPAPEPTPAPEPEPTPATEPAPVPELEPGPAPAPEPAPAVAPAPEPAPAPVGPAAPQEPSEREKMLEAMVEDLQGKLLARPPAEPAATVQPTPTPAPAEPEPLNFLGDQKLDEILDDPEKFNTLLVGVYNRALEEGGRVAAESTLRQIPQLVTTYVARHATLSGLVSDFYKANPDLVNVKKTVAAVANEVAAENPDLSVEDVFGKVAERTRKVLGLKAGASPPIAPVVQPAEPSTPQPSEPSPAFVQQGGRTTPGGPSLTKLQKDVVDLITDQ